MLAWEINFKKGYNNILNITIDENVNTKTTALFKTLKNQNIPIVNLGVIAQKEVFNKVRMLKYPIFPSFVETIGLNLLESTLLGCKVLASDSDYVKEIIKPSLVFNPKNSEDIAEKVRFV